MTKLHVVGHLTIDYLVNAASNVVEIHPEGAALGAAIGALLAGGKPVVHAVAGFDYPRDVIQRMAELGADVGGVEWIRSPSLRFWLLDEGHDVIVDHPFQGTDFAIYNPLLNERFLETVRPGDWVHICPLPLRFQSRVASLASAAGAQISVDPQPWHYFEGADATPDFTDLCNHTDVLFMSRQDFAEELRSPSMFAAWCHARGVKYVVAKLDADGSEVHTASKTLRIPTQPLRSIGAAAAGAGDSFAGAFISSLVQQLPLSRVAARATSVALSMIKSNGMMHALSSNPRVVEQMTDLLDRGATCA
jgi:sugar/nucleoside kinase (ribokinase family)